MHIDPALSFVTRPVSEVDALVTRARCILETRPGQLPWSPRFGVNLDALAQGAATAGQVALIRSRIHEALVRGLPEGSVLDTEVRVTEVGPGTASGGPVPFAERALASAGTRATLEVRVRLSCRGTPITLEARLDG